MRRNALLDLMARPGSDIDWTGLEKIRASAWQCIPHFFQCPLYFIEYGIAQLGALQVWRNWRQEPASALRAYRLALSLGGSRTLPELFDAAGARFGLDEALVEELAGELRAGLERSGQPLSLREPDR